MQLKILTSSQEEYEQILKIAEKNNIPSIHIHAPEDSVASVVWSVDDVREHFPKGTKDEIILKGLINISSSIRDNMTASGWETINELKYELLEGAK